MSSSTSAPAADASAVPTSSTSAPAADASAVPTSSTSAPAADSTALSRSASDPDPVTKSLMERTAEVLGTLTPREREILLALRATWAIVTLFPSGRRLAGRVQEHRQYGAQGVLVEVPQPGGTFASQFHAGPSLASVCHVPEQDARAAAARLDASVPGVPPQAAQEGADRAAPVFPRPVLQQLGVVRAAIDDALNAWQERGPHVALPMLRSAQEHTEMLAKLLADALKDARSVASAAVAPEGGS